MFEQRVRRLGRRLIRQRAPGDQAPRDWRIETNRRLRARVESLTQERDAARLAAVGSDATEKLDFLFVVTYGRSGSTLLMGLLDAIPGYCIRGENEGVVYDLFNYQTKAIRARTAHSKEGTHAPTSAWYGIEGYPEKVATAHMRQLVLDTLLRPPPDTRVTGFKEVRWWMPKPVEYLDFIETLFPGARFILCTRNLDDVVKSGWYRMKSTPRAELAKVEDRLRDTVDRRGDRGYHVHYDDFVRDPSALRGMYEWLGEEYDEERVAQVLATPHSSSTSAKKRST